jgi:hypothetical protein
VPRSTGQTLEVLRAITDAQRNAPAYQELGWNGQAITVTTRRRGNATAVLLAQLAEAAASLLASPAIGLVRRCEGPGCGCSSCLPIPGAAGAHQPPAATGPASDATTSSRGKIGKTPEPLAAGRDRIAE